MSENSDQHKPNEDNSPDDIIKSTVEIAKNKFFKNPIIKNFFSPAVMTVAITAVAGPCAVNSVNNRIETLKLQKDVIDRVMPITMNTNFKNPDEINKIQVISRMLSENKPIFGLDFSKTEETYVNLHKEALNIGEFEKEIELKTEKVEVLEKDKKEKLKIIKKFAKEKSSLQTDKNKLLDERQQLDTSQVAKIKALDNKIKNKELKIQQKQSEITAKEKEKEGIDKQLNDYKQQNKDLRENIDLAKEEVANLTEAVDEYKNIVTKHATDKKALQAKVLDIKNLLNKYQNRNNALTSKYKKLDKTYEI